MSGVDYVPSVSLEIFLNVYDLHESISMLSSVGLGLFHTGVEIKGVEFSFSNHGISRSRPKLPEFGNFREQIHIGTFDEGMEFVNSMVAALSSTDFKPGTYDVITRNCNHFSNALCMSLCSTGIPAWVNRAASIGAAVRSSAYSSDGDKNVDRRYSSSAIMSQEAFDDKPQSFFSWLLGSRPATRSVVQGEVSVVATSERKELTEKQKALLVNLKSKNNGKTANT